MPVEIRNFKCVVTDYRMSSSSGLELLSWIQERDSRLATTIVAAEGEKSLLTEVLRGGIVDFSDKPISLEPLHTTVALAIDGTHQQRHLVQSLEEVKQLGSVRRRFLAGEVARTPMPMDIRQ